MKNEELAKIAFEQTKKSYAPYSKFCVGVCLLTKSGKIFTGCNIENSAYGSTICAERVAFAKAISEGEKKFEAIAIASNNKNKKEQEFPFPCGSCRQFMSEFCSDLKIIVARKNKKLEIVETSLKELLPHSFGPQK